MAAYAYYRLHRYSSSLVVIDEGIHCSTNTGRFNRLLLMIRIHERDLYEAFHLITRIKAEP